MSSNASDEVRRTEPSTRAGDRRWWAAVPLIVMVVAPLVVVFGEPLGIAGALVIIAVGHRRGVLAVRMAVRPSTSGLRYTALPTALQSPDGFTSPRPKVRQYS